MNSIIDGEVMIRLDALTLIYLKMHQLEAINPRPANYSEIIESLIIELNNTRDGLIEYMISKNIPIVQEKLKAKTHE